MTAPPLKAKSPYLRAILEQCVNFPCLQSISRWYTSNLPTRHQCRIACIEFSTNTGLPNARRLTPDDLTHILNNSKTESDGIIGRILIVEDLTPDIVELLGYSLRINPLFFAAHLHVSRSERTADQPDVRILPSRYKELGFLGAMYYRTLTFYSSEGSSKLLCDSNVRRKGGTWPISEGVSGGLVQGCFSAILTNKKDVGWLGLVLVDPAIRSSFFIDERGKQRSNVLVNIRTVPFQGGYEDFLPTRSCPSVGDDTVHCPPRTSMLDDLTYHWTREIPSNFDPRAPTLLSLSYYPLRIIGAEWTNFANLLLHSVEQMEYSAEPSSDIVLDVKGLESSILRLQSFRRRIMTASYNVRSLAYVIKSVHSEEPSMETWKVLLNDFEQIVTRFDIYGRRFDAMIPVLTSFIQLEETRRSLTETKSITRLTYLALTFIPPTFITGLFSMDGDFSPGNRLFWVYFAVSIPLMSGICRCSSVDKATGPTQGSQLLNQFQKLGALKFGVKLLLSICILVSNFYSG